jgi:hypothetical protein
MCITAWHHLPALSSQECWGRGTYHNHRNTWFGSRNKSVVAELGITIYTVKTKVYTYFSENSPNAKWRRLPRDRILRSKNSCFPKRKLYGHVITCHKHFHCESTLFHFSHYIQHSLLLQILLFNLSPFVLLPQVALLLLQPQPHAFPMSEALFCLSTWIEEGCQVQCQPMHRLMLESRNYRIFFIPNALRAMDTRKTI